MRTLLFTSKEVNSLKKKNLALANKWQEIPWLSLCQSSRPVFKAYVITYILSKFLRR